jgi:hypothetical protein
MIAVVSCVVGAFVATKYVDAQDSMIVAENKKPGSRDWLLKERPKGSVPPKYEPADEPYAKGWRRRKELEGYCSHTSIAAGETLKIFVSTEPVIGFKIDIYRMGYYGGAGGRLVKSIGPLQGTTQETPADGKNNLVECRWTASAEFEIPKDWVSGVYLGKLISMENDLDGYIVFIVRDDRKADLMFQCSDMTWQAYNRWPNWRSLYDKDGDPWGAGGNRIGYDISFNRPYALYWNGFPAGFEPLTNGSGEFLMTEFPLAYWLEKEGYDVTYVSNVDAHRDANGLKRVKAFLSVGHDEYWTKEMFANIAAARDAGVSIAFLSGNSVSGEVALLPAADGTEHRSIRRIGGLPEEEKLLGAKSYGVGFNDWYCSKPDHWVFEGTHMKEGDRVPQLVGWEFHGPPLAEYPSLEVLATGPTFGWNGEKSSRTYATTIYTAPKGNFVFNACTCWWNMVLSKPPGFINPPRRYFLENDPRIQRITKNILDRMISVAPVGIGP